MKNKIILIVLSTLMLVSSYNTFAEGSRCVQCEFVTIDDCWLFWCFKVDALKCEDIECPPEESDDI